MTDEQLQTYVARATGGDRDAFQQIIIHFHTPLERKVAAALDIATARRVSPEDILQETYTRAYERITSYEFNSPGGAYKLLEKIALRLVKDQQLAHRREKRDVRREAQAAGRRQSSCERLIDVMPDDRRRPSEGLRLKQAQALAISSLARLTPDQQAVVRMRFLEERPVKEIAAALDKSPEAIFKLCKRALDKLSTHLGSASRHL